MFTFGEKLSQFPPVPKDHSVMPPPPRNASSPSVATVYNKLTGVQGGYCVSSEHPAYLAPALCTFSLLSVVFSASPIALS
jgi:hypothetical protein